MVHMLSIQSVIGKTLYCLKKISKLALLNKRSDYEKYTGLYTKLITHSRKKQEEMVVLLECFTILQLHGVEAYKEYVKKLKNENRTYYNFFSPLKFLLDIIIKDRSILPCSRPS